MVEIIEVATARNTRGSASRAAAVSDDAGRVLEMRFSGKRGDPASDAAHADISGQLPGASEWRR
jgi:hypothetical protein